MPNFFLTSQFLPVSLVIIAVWLLAVTILFIRSERRFVRLTKGISRKDLRTILESLRKNNRLSNKEIEKVKQSLTATQGQAKLHLQNIGFLRYNPFSDTGGDQSFCLSLLDDNGSGVVISSLHSRDQTRIYAKRIKAGKSPGYTLSKEERAVIKEANKRH